MDQVRPLPTRSLREHAKRRLVDLSSSNPIRWRPCADPVQKRDPGERTTQEGLTNRGSLQKGGQKRACAVLTISHRLRSLLVGTARRAPFAHPTSPALATPPCWLSPPSHRRLPAA